MNYSDPIIDGYYDYCLSIKKLKQTSVKDIRCSLNKLQKYLLENEVYEYIWKLELSVYIQFFSVLREKGERGTGISKQVSHLRSFVDYCWRAEYCNKNPLVGFSIKDDSPQYQPRFLTLEEASSLISATDRKTRFGRKERLIILILYGLGLRTSELCGIKIKDVSIDEQDLFVKGKFDIERRIPFPDGVWVELLAYLHEADLKRGLLFRTEHKKTKLSVADVGLVVKKYSAFAKLEGGVTPKSLRHTFASRLIGEGIDIIRIFKSSGVIDYYYTDKIDEPVMMKSNGSVYYLHTDQLGSIIAITDIQGSTIEQYAYSAFGQMKIYDGSGVEIQSSQIGNIFGFTGREFDAESDLYYYRARYYSTQTGRFISEDPIGFAGGDSNLYRYVGNSSLINVDPFGENAVVSAIAVGTVVGLLALTTRSCSLKERRNRKKKNKNSTKLSDDPKIRKIQERNIERNRRMREGGL